MRHTLSYGTAIEALSECPLNQHRLQDVQKSPTNDKRLSSRCAAGLKAATLLPSAKYFVAVSTKHLAEHKLLLWG